MTRAPHVDNGDLSRSLHRLWPRLPAQIQGTTGRKPPDATENNANRSKNDKKHIEFAPKSPETSARAGRAKAISLLRSP